MILWSIHSCFHWCKNFKNRPRDARVIVVNKCFYGTLCIVCLAQASDTHTALRVQATLVIHTCGLTSAPSPNLVVFQADATHWCDTSLGIASPPSNDLPHDVAMSESLLYLA